LFGLSFSRFSGAAPAGAAQVPNIGSARDVAIDRLIWKTAKRRVFQITTISKELGKANRERIYFNVLWVVVDIMGLRIVVGRR
jgi:hypothetical protein